MKFRRLGPDCKAEGLGFLEDGLGEAGGEVGEGGADVILIDAKPVLLVVYLEISHVCSQKSALTPHSFQYMVFEDEGVPKGPLGLGAPGPPRHNNFGLLAGVRGVCACLVWV